MNKSDLFDEIFKVRCKNISPRFVYFTQNPAIHWERRAKPFFLIGSGDHSSTTYPSASRFSARAACICFFLSPEIS